MEKIDEILESLSALKDGLETKEKVMKEPHYDKVGFGFNLDSRFSAGEVRVSFDSWKGTYGNSGCSTIFQFIPLFEELLVNYLNSHKNEIIKWMIASLETKRREFKDTKKRELREQLKEVENW